MKFKKFFASFVLFATLLTASFSATRRGSDLVPSGHWVYDALAQIEIDFGRWNFVDHTPLTIMELKGILQEIPYEKLSKPAQEQYLRVQEYFSQFDFSLDAGIFSLGIEPKLNVEGYAKSNSDLKWLYDYHDRQRLAEAPIRITFAYQESDLFILPSVHEPFGIVVLEAWSAKLPAIVSQVGGLRTLVEPGRNGFHFDPQDVGSMKAAYHAVMNSRKQIIENAYQEVLDRYSWDTVTASLLRFYEEVKSRR